jgi:hypothetical protein
MSQYPSGSLPKSASSGNVANASAVATIAAPANGRNYVTGFIVTATGATAASIVLITLTGLAGGTMTFVYAVPAGVLVGAQPYVVPFSSALPASADGTAVTLTLPALGTGNTNAAVVLTGYSL